MLLTGHGRYCGRLFSNFTVLLCNVPELFLLSSAVWSSCSWLYFKKCQLKHNNHQRNVHYVDMSLLFVFTIRGLCHNCTFVVTW